MAMMAMTTSNSDHGKRGTILFFAFHNSAWGNATLTGSAGNGYCLNVAADSILGSADSLHQGTQACS